MALGYKVGLLIAGVFVVSGVASVAVDRLVLVPSYHELERLEAERNTGRAVEAIHHELHVLSSNVAAWVWRDELERSLASARFTQSFGEQDPPLRELSFAAFYESGGRQRLRLVLAGPAGADFGRFESGSLSPRHPLLRRALQEGEAAGLVSTPSGPMLVAARPIRLESEAEPGGVLVFGRLLDTHSVGAIAERFRLDMQVVPAATAPPPAPEAGPPEDWVPGQPRRSTWVRPDPDGRALVGQTLIADLHGDPIVALLVRTPRAISARGERASLFALATLGGVGLAVLIVLLALLHHTVLAPLARLTAHAVEIGRDASPPGSLALARRDEIGVLASELDRMTGRLAAVRRRLVDQSFLSGRAEMASGILHNLGNAVTPIAVRIEGALHSLKSAYGEELERAAGELDDPSTPDSRRGDLVRFLQLAGLELSDLLRSLTGDLEGASSQIAHVQEILSDQERFSRAETPPDDVVDLEDLIHTAAATFAAPLQRSFDLHVGATLAGLSVAGPRVQLQQIVANLLLNAAEAIEERGSDARGRISVSAERVAASDPRQIHIRIEDDGAGIPQSHLESLFLRGFSTKERGSGLGLHWSATAAGALGGRIHAESEGPGRGAVLHLYLPEAEASGAEVASGDRREEA